MINLRNTLAIALTTATLGLGALAATPAAAHEFHGGFHGGHGHFGHFGHFGHRYGWGHGHFGHRWGYGHRWGFEHRWGYGGRCIYHWGFGCHRGYEHRWGYRWGGYRHVVEYRVVAPPVVVEQAPAVAISPVCPPGTHFGHEGNVCFPNRE